MKFQNVYESNFDYERTYEALLSTLKGVDKTQKGLISFRFKPKNIEVLLSPRGKIQVAWSFEKEKEEFLPILKSLLRPPEGQKLTLKPLHMNILKVPHPGPKKFTLAWCKEKTTYIRKLNSRLQAVIKEIPDLFYLFMLVIILGLMIPIVFQIPQSVNTTAWNFTGSEQAKILLNIIVYVYPVLFVSIIALWVLKIKRALF